MVNNKDRESVNSIIYHTQKGTENKKGLSFPQFQKSKDRIKINEKIPVQSKHLFLEIKDFIKDE